MESEVLKQNLLVGTPVRKEEIKDQELEITDFKPMPSKFSGQFALMQVELAGSKLTVAGNGFMLKQLRQVMKNKFPIKAKFTTTGKYWRLVRSDMV